MYGGIRVFGAATPNINFSPVHGNSGNADVSFDGNDLKIISNSSSADVRIGAYSKLTHFVIRPNGRIGVGTDSPSNSSLLHLYSTTFDPYLRVGGGTRDCGITLQPNNAFNALRSDSANRLWVNAGADSIRFTVGGDSSSYEKLRIESWGGIHNNQSAIYGGGVGNEPKVHFNGAAPSNDPARGQLAVSDSANYNASPIARISLVTRYNSAGGYTFMGGIEGGKENSTDGQYGGFVRLVVRKHGQGNVEGLRVTSAGYVGIDKPTNVSAKLNIGDSSNDGALSQLIKLGNDSSGAGTGSQINMGLVHGNESTSACIAGFLDSAGGTSFIVKTAGTYANQSTVAERLRITSDGKLGVGNFSSTSVAQQLHVRGSEPKIYLEHTGGYDMTLTTSDGAGNNGITVNGGALSLAYNNKNIWMCVGLVVTYLWVICLQLLG